MAASFSPPLSLAFPLHSSGLLSSLIWIFDKNFISFLTCCTWFPKSVLLITVQCYLPHTSYPYINVTILVLGHIYMFKSKWSITLSSRPVTLFILSYLGYILSLLCTLVSWTVMSLFSLLSCVMTVVIPNFPSVVNKVLSILYSTRILYPEFRQMWMYRMFILLYNQ